MVSIGCPNCGEDLKNPGESCPHCKNTLPEIIQKLLLEKSPKPKRPILVWVISISYLIAFGSFLPLSIYFVIVLEEPKLLGDLFLLIFDHPLTFLASLLYALAAITLFLLRKVAFYLFSANFILYILMTAWQIQTKDWITETPTSLAVGVFIGVGLNLAICLYSRNLIKKGILS